MRERRSPFWSAMYSPLSVVIVFVFALLLARSTWGVYKKGAVAAERNAASLYELEQLEARKATLVKEISDLENTEGMEQALRAKFPVAREGEEVIVIGKETAQVGVATSTNQKKGGKGFVDGFWVEQ